MVTTDETIAIPIELYLENELNKKKENKKINEINSQNSEIKNPYNEIFKEDINQNLNINEVEEENNKINQNDKKYEGFEVLEQEDFINAMNNIKGKKTIDK